MAQQELSREVQEIWELFRRVARQQEETGKHIDRLALQQEESVRKTDREIRALQELFTGQWGKLIEALVEPSVLKLFQKRGIQVIDTSQRVKTKRNGKQMEIDILATNDESVVVIEVKTTLKVEDVNYFLEKLKIFTEFFPRYAGMKIHGAVAGVRIEEESDKYAYRKGLFVLTLSGEDMVVILNDEKFKPKEW